MTCRCVKLVAVNVLVYFICSSKFISVCVATRETSKIKNILTGNITGDPVPSAYPVLKINQSANNDSSFYNHYSEELKEIEAEAMELMKHREQTVVHSKLLTQQNESMAALNEVKLVDDDAKIFKTTGPVLSAQTKQEALSTITKRLEYIKGEIDTVDRSMSDLQAKIEEKYKKVKKQMSG
nr:prefoldin subunit [Theileria orientalis]